MLCRFPYFVCALLFLLLTKLDGVSPTCVSCSADSLKTLSVADAKASGMAQAISTSTPIGTVGTNGVGCTTLKLTCGEGQIVSIHVNLASGGSDYGNYDSGFIVLDCNAQGQWVVPENGQHPGDVVDGYSCVTSSTVG
ncbi:hypothetical protein niasHT_035366 [Heterodera trifolii]|uniref:C6 domain-containing protein n=1 Tax=Heterodera trifolii TaxID=157864 RepID=A0ABD2I6F2_9BILA